MISVCFSTNFQSYKTNVIEKNAEFKFGITFQSTETPTFSEYMFDEVKLLQTTSRGHIIGPAHKLPDDASVTHALVAEVVCHFFGTLHILIVSLAAKLNADKFEKHYSGSNLRYC